MEKYLERLKTEIEELKAKHERLDDYLNKTKQTGTSLDDSQIQRLKNQYYYMFKYIEVLEIRYIYDTELAEKEL